MPGFEPRISWVIPGLFFLIFVFSTVNMFILKFRRCLDLNRVSLVSKATAMPAEPQPLPEKQNIFNGPFPAYFSSFLSFQQLTVNMFILKFRK